MSKKNKPDVEEIHEGRRELVRRELWGWFLNDQIEEVPEAESTTVAVDVSRGIRIMGYSDFEDGETK